MDPIRSPSLGTFPPEHQLEEGQRTWFDVRPSDWRPSLGVEPPSEEAALDRRSWPCSCKPTAGVHRHMVLDGAGDDRPRPRRRNCGRRSGSSARHRDPAGSDESPTGSANGTFLGGARLPPVPTAQAGHTFHGQLRALATYVDSAGAAIPSCAHRRGHPWKIAALAGSPFTGRRPKLSSAVALRVTPARPTRAGDLEALLGFISLASRSWIDT